MPVFLLSEKLSFPPPHMASKQGLLAVGGDLSPERLLLAYRQGIFPWFSPGEPILWWSPDPRMVLFPDEIRISKSLKKVLNQGRFRVTCDAAFSQVIAQCAQIRQSNREETWITPDMIAAYTRLHAQGYAHSVEAWENDELVGGLYGVSLGRCFFGESMFSRASNASKVALVHLAALLSRSAFDLIDCQVASEHLASMGARIIPRAKFLSILNRSMELPAFAINWHHLGQHS